MTSPMYGILDSQRRNSICIIISFLIFWEVAIGFAIYNVATGPFGAQPIFIVFLLGFAIFPPIAFIGFLRIQSGMLTGMQRAVKQSELSGIPRYCPHCGGHIDLDEIAGREESFDFQCPYCGARL